MAFWRWFFKGVWGELRGAVRPPAVNIWGAVLLVGVGGFGGAILWALVSPWYAFLVLLVPLAVPLLAHLAWYEKGGKR